MPKKTLINFLFLLPVFLGISSYLFLDFEDYSSPQAQTQKISQRSTKLQKRKEQEALKASHDSRSSSPEKNLAEYLKNEKISINKRILAIKKLDLKTHRVQKKNIDQLLNLINSPNPYKEDIHAQSPHNFQAYRLKQEASLRVYALKRISSALPKKKLKLKLTKIMKNNPDIVIQKIAKQVILAAKKGENYFENIKQGIKNMKLPANEVHDH